MDPELLSKHRRGKSDSGRREQGDREKKVLLLRRDRGLACVPPEGHASIGWSQLDLCYSQALVYDDSTSVASDTVCSLLSAARPPALPWIVQDPSLAPPSEGQGAWRLSRRLGSQAKPALNLQEASFLPYFPQTHFCPEHIPREGTRQPRARPRRRVGPSSEPAQQTQLHVGLLIIFPVLGY